MSNNRYNINNNINKNDLLIVGNPQISYFSSVFRRHTYFNIYEQTYNISSGDESIKIQDLPHLLKSVSLDLNITGNIEGDNIGTSVLDNIHYRFNDNVIEHLSGSYIEIHNQLNTPLNIYSKYTITDDDISIDSKNLLNVVSGSGGVFFGTETNKSIRLRLNIPFSFSQNIGNAIPVFLFKDNHIHFHVELDTAYTYSNGYGSNLVTEIVELHEEEVNRFKSSNNEYIYTRVYNTQLNYSNGVYTIPTYEIYNNIKTIIWDTTIDYEYNIEVNGQSLFLNTYLDRNYFTRVFPKKAGLPGCGRTYPATPTPTSSNKVSIICNDNIHYYTFGLKEEQYGGYGGYGEYDQPNGSINSSINKIKIKSRFPSDGGVTTTNDIQFYLLCYNIISYADNIVPKYVYGQRNQTYS